MTYATPVDEQYFASVINEMKDVGFKPFSRVVISTKDAEYVVRMAYARVTSLFFHSPNKNCIIILSYREHDYGEGEGLSGYWHLQLNLEYRGLSPQTKALARGATIYERQFPCPGFVSGSCSSHGEKTSIWNLEQENWRIEPQLDPKVLASNVYTALKEHLPLLASAPFQELWVSDWVPSFPGCETLFWERFREGSASFSSARYLWSLVSRPWGSKGLKR